MIFKNEFILARKLCNQPLDGLTFEKFQKALQMQLEKLSDEDSADVEVLVDTSFGKAKIKLIPNRKQSEPYLLAGNG